MKFKNVPSTVTELVTDIKTGNLGLPEIQRPFVWNDSKVRDLLDSMMHGYPIGHVMLWKNPDKKNKVIGASGQAYYEPEKVIIDGQQRLTSLYAVFTGHKVFNEDFELDPIVIAYNPIENKFEVGNKATENSAEWISNITEVFRENSHNAIKNFMKEFKKRRAESGETVSDAEENLISGNIDRLYKLGDFSIPTVDLKDVTKEEVAEIFVRVNSQGVSLKQHDFILTLLALYWDDGRAQIEEFSLKSRRPSANRNEATSYNQIIEVKQSDLVRVMMAYTFYRARLKYGYKFLRGADFDKKGEIDETKREERFADLKKALPAVLNVNDWHDFVKAVMVAGYHSREMVTSKMALFYSYALYLIAKHRLKATPNENENITALWFFYASLLSIYSSAPESTMESHLSEIRHFKTLDEYKSFVMRKLDERLTDGYFERTLTGSDGLAVSGAGNNAWYAYVAALIILDAKVLFSRNSLLLAKKFGPAIDGKRKSVEKHHLFPKAYLKKEKGFDDKLTDQMANYAYIDWKDNMDISDVAPAEYYFKGCEGMTEEEVLAMEAENALPHGWEKMEYKDFLEARRKLMAAKIKQAYEKLRKNVVG